jgi:hypothetical protein
LYIKECNLVNHACSRDIEIINYLIDVVQAGYNIGTSSLPISIDIDTIANEIQVISNKSIECQSFELLSLPQKRITKVVNTMTAREIIKGITDVKIKKYL